MEWHPPPTRYGENPLFFNPSLSLNKIPAFSSYYNIDKAPVKMAKELCRSFIACPTLHCTYTHTTPTTPQKVSPEVCINIRNLKLKCCFQPVVWNPNEIKNIDHPGNWPQKIIEIIFNSKPFLRYLFKPVTLNSWLSCLPTIVD